MLEPCQVCASWSSLQRNCENMSLYHFEELICHPGFFNLREHNHFRIVCFITLLWKRDVTCFDVPVALTTGEKITCKYLKHLKCLRVRNVLLREASLWPELWAHVGSDADAASCGGCLSHRPAPGFPPKPLEALTLRGCTSHYLGHVLR